MEGSGNNLVLLFLCELDEVYGVARNSDCKLRIKLGVLLCVNEKLSVKHVYVEVVTALEHIAVKQCNKVVVSLLLGFAECGGNNRKCI